jgi:hypothetical protein
VLTSKEMTPAQRARRLHQLNYPDQQHLDLREMKKLAAKDPALAAKAEKIRQEQHAELVARHEAAQRALAGATGSLDLTDASPLVRERAERRLADAQAAHDGLLIRTEASAAELERWSA